LIVLGWHLIPSSITGREEAIFGALSRKVRR
jgi:hypothetical protein